MLHSKQSMISLWPVIFHSSLPPGQKDLRNQCRFSFDTRIDSKKILLHMRKLILVLCIANLLFACKPKDYTVFTHDPMLYCKTVKKLNDVVLYNNFSPVVASRNYAYANIAAYECMVAGDSNYASLSGQIRHMPSMPRPAAGTHPDYPLASMLAFVKVGNAVTFPEGVLMDYWNELKKGAEDAGMPGDVLNNTVQYSDAVAAAVLAWSKKDNYAQTRSSEKFTVTQEDGRWIPTPPAYAQAMEPHWCDIRPMLLD